MIETIGHNLFSIIVGIAIAILGIVIQKTKSYSWIAGYNTMSPTERKKINIELAAKAIRNTFIVLGLIWIIIPIISDFLGLSKLKYLILVGLHLAVCILLIIIVNTQDKYKIKIQNSKNQP
jgi:hypothetical protein